MMDHSLPSAGDPITGNLVDSETAQVISAQLGRPARAVLAVEHRCACGQPDVVRTGALLPDGTPFPTVFYLTCPAACAAVSRLEAAGWMRRWQQQLGEQPQVAAQYEQAHAQYVAQRQPQVAVLEGVSAGGMPTRVKCLHALVAHSLAAGLGVNPVGDAALEQLSLVGQGPERCWGSAQCCHCLAQPQQPPLSGEDLRRENAQITTQIFPTERGQL